ncbi:RIIA lysis inhibitor [Stenotrophomonas phage Philippe]|uniref:RIIa-like protein n=1 Tax=Stenotrophomonas phage Philippe TaxID=2859655 RepID=A0AAE7WNF0_9CAUD|nr:RIIA lysis inhibitor [Stenotrophomonas phage Philippe]QYW02255.1 rIIa-like protein [Stenotrophomonas phage Philippe]
MEVVNSDRRANAALIGSAGDAAAVTVANNRAFLEMLSSNLYSRPKEAMIREILCNGDDAHIDNGYEGPLEITLDSTENVLKIRDFGKGIPHDKIGEIYGTYGGSTKAGDSMATGGFGLGCKSPWSYTDVFTVTNCHGGTKTIYSMVKTSPEHNGMPAIVPILSMPTDETGVEVRVDIRAGDLYEIEALLKQTVLRGGIKATLHGTPMVAVDYSNPEDYTFLARYNLGSDREMIMIKYGAVLYPVKSHEIYLKEYRAITAYMESSDTIILKAPSDSLVISPSRENVSYVDKTVKTIWELLRKFMMEINRKAEPYAKDRIRDGNRRMIKARGTDWLSDYRGYTPTSYMLSPMLPKPAEEMSVFDKVIHRSITVSYPSQFGALDLIHRVKETNKLFWTGDVGPWIKQRWQTLADHLINVAHKREFGTAGHALMRKAAIHPMLRVLARNGLDKEKLLIINADGWRNSESWNDSRRPVRLEKVDEHEELEFDDIYHLAMNAVILSHTIAGAADGHFVRGRGKHMIYIVPRNQSEVDRVLQVFKTYGIPVMDLTPNQQSKTVAATAKRSANIYPSLGWLRATKKTNHSGLPFLDRSRDQPATSYVSDPKVYIMCSIRRGTDTVGPMDLPSHPYRKIYSFLPDDTAIVTTALEVKRLRKGGAISLPEFIIKTVCELWNEPNVRKLWFYLGHTIREESVHCVPLNAAKRILKSDWCRQQMGVTLDMSTAEMDKLDLLVSFSDYEYTIKKAASEAAEIPLSKADPFNMTRHLKHASKPENYPAKLIMMHKRMQSNPFFRESVVSLDAIMRLEQTADDALKAKLGKILSITLE